MADIAYAVIDKVDNATLIIVNKLTAVVAQIKDLFVSRLTLLPGGSITLPRGENQIAGSGLIPAGEHEVFVENNQIDDFSLISITPTSNITSPLYVASKTTGKGFLVRMDKAADEDVTFDWFSVKTYDFEEQKTTVNDEADEVSSEATTTEPAESGDDAEEEATSTDSTNENTVIEGGDQDTIINENAAEVSSGDGSPDQNTETQTEEGDAGEADTETAPDTSASSDTPDSSSANPPAETSSSDDSGSSDSSAQASDSGGGDSGGASSDAGGGE